MRFLITMTAWSDETNDSKLKCGGCCGAKKNIKQDAEPQDTVPAPGLQTENSLAASVSSEKLDALIKETRKPA